MTTPVRGRTLRSRLLAFITNATSRLTTTWRILTNAQTRFLTRLANIRPGRSASAKIRAAAVIFQQSLAEFDREATGFIERWAATDLPLAYREGALGMLDRADRPHRKWSWTARHQAAITTLSAQFYADLVNRLREALRRARAFLRAALDAARIRFGRFEYGRIDPAVLRREHPLGTVIYANDARFPVEAWARAALAWQAVTTANTGGVRTAMDELSCDWVQVSDGPDCGWAEHNDDDRADGTLRTTLDALAHLTAHPNCVREFWPHFERPDTALGALA